MANPKGPPEHTRWKPGQSGNPGGKPPMLITKDKVSGILGKFAHASREELQDVLQNPKSTMLELMIASVMARAAKDGDPTRLEFLLQRSIGKIGEMHTIEMKQWNNDLKRIPIETLKEIGREPDE